MILDAFCGVGGNTIAFAKTCEKGKCSSLSCSVFKKDIRRVFLVIAMDNSPLRLALARHNAIIYGVEDRIEFILGDFLSFAKAYRGYGADKAKSPIDVVFLSPPWGGPSYLTDSPTKEKGLPSFDTSHPESGVQTERRYTLDMISPIPGDDLIELTRNITNNIAFFLPRNTDVNQISALVPEKDEMVEVEEGWMGNKLKALTCYFGGLAVGQEHLF